MTATEPDLHREWDTPDTELVIPPPEVPAHLIDWRDKILMPQGVRTIGQHAERNGFNVIGSHCRGPWIGGNPMQVLRICESVLLRMSHADGRRASALWITDVDPTSWSLECAFLLRPVLTKVASKDLRAYLKTDEPEPDVDLATFDVP